MTAVNSASLTPSTLTCVDPDMERTQRMSFQEHQQETSTHLLGFLKSKSSVPEGLRRIPCVLCVLL